MKLLVATVLVLLTVAMAASHDVTTRPVLADNQLYFYMAERCASGVPPHVAHWEVKTQLPTLLSGAAMAVGRRFGVDDVPAGRTATVAAAAIAVVLAWLLALELTASAAASVAGAAAVFAIYGLFLEAASGFQPKLYMVAFMLAAHLQCAQRRWLGTGITAMAAFLCWQPAGLVLASCAVAALLDRHGGRSAFARLSAGALSALAAYEAWFLWQGALAAQVHQELFLAFGSTYTPIDWRKSVWFLLTEARAFEHAPHLVPTAFAGATATLWAGLLVRPRRAFAMLREKPGLVAFWTAAHLVTLFTLIDHQAHPDMLLVQPYFAVACGIAFGWIESLVRRAPGGAVLVWMATAMVVAEGWSIASRDAARSRVGANDLAAQYAIPPVLGAFERRLRDACRERDPAARSCRMSTDGIFPIARKARGS